MRKRWSGPTRYAIYLRCSTDDQAQGDFTTVQVQEELNRVHVLDQRGTVAGVYSDAGFTGTNLKRPDWKRLHADAQTGCFEVVVCTYMSRLGRGDAGTVAEYLLRECGVRVEYVKESFTADLAGFVNKAMTRFVDAMYVENVRQWTKTKMKAMVEQGYFCGGTVPFGYRSMFVEGASFSSRDKEPPKRLVKHEEDAETVLFAFELFRQRRSLAVVRDHLKAVSGRPLTTTSARRLLTNEAYLGIQQFGEWRNEYSWEPIVPAELFDTVQQALKCICACRAPRQDRYTYLLRGRVVCPHCGCLYSPTHAKSGAVAYYGCLHDMKRRTSCPVKRINADALHFTAMGAIEEAAKHPTNMRRILAACDDWQEPSAEAQSMRAQFIRRKQLVAAQIANVTRAVAEGRALGPLLDTLEKLETEQTHICKELEAAEEQVRRETFRRPTAAEVQDAWLRIVELWEKVPEEDQPALLGAIVKRVDVLSKEEVALQLSVVAEPHSEVFEINSRMGG